MGELKISKPDNKTQMQYFMRALLKDVQALDYMLKNDWFEDDITRIGAEQEMFLIGKKTLKTMPVNTEIIDKMGHPEWLKTELARFNLETNLTPVELNKDCFRRLENESNNYLEQIRKVAHTFGAEVILTGILPTLQRYDMEMHNLTQKNRYIQLLEVYDKLKQNSYNFNIRGIDELRFRHTSSLLPACNTSFQMHLQVAPDDFVKYYNIAQAIAAPVLAMGANSALAFGKRLWHESRIILYQQALDTRAVNKHMREYIPRVNFGFNWLENSVLNIYKEDISRFRVLVSDEIEEDAQETIKQGKTPALKALQLHNSTVYRWNRPCYGISPNGKPHLRIENRMLPAGPSVIDETANAAFWVGTITGIADEIADIRDHISFADVKDNFGKAARYGIDSKFIWFNDRKTDVARLVLKELLPVARKGLKSRGVATGDINRYLGIIEKRAKNHVNGGSWMLKTYNNLIPKTSKADALAVITSGIIDNQWKNKPVHSWKIPESEHPAEDLYLKELKVEQLMQTELFTVHKDDVIELVADLMTWRKVQCICVEDKDSRLLGIISKRHILRCYTNNGSLKNSNITAKDIMVKDMAVIHPNASIKDALHLMKEKKMSCLPVVEERELVGMITETDFFDHDKW